MSEPKRYTGKTEGSLLGSPHWEHPEGEWVKWEDYARLQAENERLRKAGDAMAKRTEFFQKRWDLDELCQEVEAWNAAKEGKPQS